MKNFKNSICVLLMYCAMMPQWATVTDFFYDTSAFYSHFCLNAVNAAIMNQKEKMRGRNKKKFALLFYEHL